MPLWKDYKAEAKARGALAHELYVVQSIPDGAPEDVKAVLPEHLAYQAEQEAAGRLFMAGPMSDETGEQMQGVGLIIYRAESLEHARALAEDDPMHAKGARRFTLQRWLINEGSLTLSVKLSAQNVGLD
ncbi:YciI family protein [Cognatishimia sp.]|uniref:YciI family protein n=1 Tax=Cognatishimia sp. TaxID=2211648 RepID=UPI003518059A